VNNNQWFNLPCIYWKENIPELELLPNKEPDELITNSTLFQETERLLVEARLISGTNGESIRKFQQNLIPDVRHID
jgi:hypothetical protein